MTVTHRRAKEMVKRGAEPCALVASARSRWSSSRLHPWMGGNCSQGGRDSLTPPRKGSRAAPPLVAEQMGRGEKKKKLHGDYFACETIRLYFLSGKTKSFFFFPTAMKICFIEIQVFTKRLEKE